MDKKKILIIEDDNILQEALKIALTEDGFEVVQAFDGESGLRITGEEKPDLVLLDLMLPKKDGYHVLSELRGDDELKSIPVIILTIVGSTTSIEECISLGAKDYLVKSDYTLENVIKKIKKAL